MAANKKQTSEWLKVGVSRALMGLGIAFLVIIVMFLISVGRFFSPPVPDLPDKIVLRYVLEDGLYETHDSGVSGFSMPFDTPDVTVQDMVLALNTAAYDDRVEGLVLRIRPGNYGLAHVQSLRRAIKNFRDQGKFAYVYSTTFGGMAPATASYYLASSFEQIWLQPVGVVGIHGFAYEAPFLKGLLDKIGIVPDIQQAGKFKSAAENITRKNMSDENRAMMTSIMDDFYDQFITDVVADREIEKQTLQTLMDNAPIQDKEALETGLITHRGYMDQFIDAVDQKTGDEARWVDLGVYSRWVMAKQKSKNKIAVIHVDGPIMDVSQRSPGPFGSMAYELSDIIGALHMAADNKKIKAVVLRINSPGGSPEASEMLRRAVTQVLEKKPVVISMGNMAASGGYWASVNGSRIVAEPMTLTGSIGVFGGKLSLPGLLESWGINVEAITKGDHANMWSLARPFTPAEEKKIQSLLENVYDTFITRVAHGRGMSVEDVKKIAQGRVYTGRQALEKGLVDQLGGVDDAVLAALVLADGDPEKGIAVLSYPQPRSALEKLASLLGGRVSMASIWGWISQGIETSSRPDGLGIYAVEMDWK